jgi:hypothetical protein
MGIEVITHQPHPRGFCVADPVHSGPVRRDTHMPRARERLREPEDVRRPIPLIRVIDLLRLPWGSRERLPGLLDQRHGLFIHTHPRALRIVRQMIDLHNILHLRHKLPTRLGRNDPQLPQRRFQRIFLGRVGPSRG